ncbi:OsmC family protein [Psychrobacter sp. R86515]|uniref:OsmC family protein n=1 Tax=Psychrobacter sp. R86515 TaxID=3093855 RepID=UPI0036D210F2
MFSLRCSFEEDVEPEEAFVASLPSCHMLFFLSIAAKRKYVIDSYIDNAVGTMEKDSDGKVSMMTVILKPQVTFSGDKQPTIEQLEKNASSDT